MSRFIVLFIILGALLSYVFCHIWVIVPFPKWGKWLAVGVAVACFCSIFLGFSGALDKMPLGWGSFFYNLGNKTLIILFYALMVFVLLDLGRLVHLVPRQWLHDNWLSSTAITALLAIVFIGGSIHYHNKQRVALNIDSHGKVQHPLTAVMASDLHIGYHNRRAELARWVDMINAENPDLILFAGDIIDMSLRPVVEEDMASEFRRLKAPIYACLGNHEFYSNLPRAKQFYHDAGINLLIDSSATVGDLQIIGRDDRTNNSRRPLSSFDIHDSQFSILLDHQPYHLEEAEQAGIDLQLSGHTHNGQVWPLNWVIKALYECGWGQHQRGNTSYYVSSGLGLWGAKYRIGTNSEYVVINIK